MVLAILAAGAEQEVVGEILVEANDRVVWQKRKLLAVRIVSNVSTSIEIKVTVEIIHRLLEVIHDVADVGVNILIVGRVELIVEELVVTRICPRVTHFQLPQAVVDV